MFIIQTIIIKTLIFCIFIYIYIYIKDYNSKLSKKLRTDEKVHTSKDYLP